MATGIAARHALAGSMVSNPARSSAFINVSGKRSGLAQAAGAPRQATASATNPASAASTASATSAPATAAGMRFLHHSSKRSSVLLVEGIERCQADVGDFLFTKGYFVT